MQDNQTANEVKQNNRTMRRIVNALYNVVEINEKIEDKRIPASPKLKKAVQESIKELCTTICDLLGTTY